MQHNENDTPITISGTPAATSGDGSPECGLPGAGGVFLQSSPPGGSPIASGLGAMESSKAATNTLVLQSPPGGRTIALSEANTNTNDTTNDTGIEDTTITRTEGHHHLYVVSDSDFDEESDSAPSPRRRSKSSPNLRPTRVTRSQSSQSSQLARPYKVCDPFVDPVSGELVVGFSKRGNVYYDKETEAQMHRRTSREKSLAKTRGVQLKKSATAKKTAKKTVEQIPETVAGVEVAAAVDAAATDAVAIPQTFTPLTTTSQVAPDETMLDLLKEITSNQWLNES